MSQHSREGMEKQMENWEQNRHLDETSLETAGGGEREQLGEIRQKFLPGCVSKWHQAFMEVKAVTAKFLSTLREPTKGSEAEWKEGQSV